MEVLTLTTKTEADGRLHVNLPTHLKSRKVELVLIMTEVVTRKAARKSFARVAGRLLWSGDAVAAQRASRNEW